MSRPSMAQTLKQEEAERKARELRWQAESDAEALVRANEVTLDPARAKMAKSLLAEQQKKNEIKAKASANAMQQLGNKVKSPKATTAKNAKAPTQKKAQPSKASANKKQTKKGGK